MNEQVKEQLLALAYEKRDEFDNRDFECLVTCIESGVIDSFEELATYGVTR